MKRSDFKYDTLENNRRELIRISKSIANNIDSLRGEISYISYDIGTGKSQSAAENIVAPLSKDRRIVILVYSYLIAKQWENMIKAKCKELNITTKIYALINPLNEHSSCSNPEIKKRSKQSIDSLSIEVCARCTAPDKSNCLSDYKSKIKISDVIITSNQLFSKHRDLFYDIDLLIFDEVTSLDLSYDLSLSDLLKLYKSIETNKDIKLDHEQHSKFNKLCMAAENYHNNAIRLSKCSEVIEPAPIDNDLIIHLEYFKDIYWKLEDRTLSDQMIDLLTKPIGLYFYPEYDYVKERVNDAGKEFWTITRTYKTTLLKSKNIYNISSYFDDICGLSKKTAVIVLSALNSKDYVEYIFGTTIKDSNCHGTKTINLFPNVINSNYHHGNSIRPENKSQAFYKKYRQDRSNIENVISHFIKKHYDDKIIIAGSKDLYEILTMTFTIPELQLNAEIIPYNRITDKQTLNKTKIIPYVHFGMSGTNTFSDYRAMLILNTHIVPPDSGMMYTDPRYEFKLTKESFRYNLQTVAQRQLEGRLLRFTDEVKLKYIYRFNYFDYDEKHMESPLSNPFLVFKQYKSIEKYLSGDIRTFKDFNKDYIYPQSNIMLYPENTESKVARSKESLFYIIIAVEYIIQASENHGGNRLIEKAIPQIADGLYNRLEVAINLKDKRSIKQRMLSVFEELMLIDLRHIGIEKRHMKMIIERVEKIHLGINS